MSNLPNNTTIDGYKIITADESNNHRHDASEIIGLSEDAIGDSFVYAEYIDGVSYSDMQNQFISESNNTMTGDLTVPNTSTSGDNIINVFELDSIKISKNIEDYDITDLPPVEEENTAIQSIMVVGESGNIHNSWIPFGLPKSDISVNGPKYVQTDTTYQLQITNYNSFSNYNVSTDVGTVDIDQNGLITLNTPSSTPSNQTITVTVSDLTNSIDKVLEISTGMNILYSDDNVEYTDLPAGGIFITEPSEFYLKLGNYYPLGYSYTASTDLPSLTVTLQNYIVIVTPPSSNSTELSGSITIDRGDTSETIDIIISVY